VAWKAKSQNLKPWNSAKSRVSLWMY
jgi:hypothetical protein